MPQISNLFNIFNRSEYYYKKINSGADKNVWVKIRRVGGQELSEKAYYTPNTAFGFSREKSLRKEFRIVSVIKDKLENSHIDIKHLAIDWTNKLGRDRVKGKFTLEVDFCENYENKINDQNTPFDARVNYARDTITGFRDLHGVGVLHGDPKPENCLINTHKGCAQIGDFGRSVLEEGGKYEGNSRFMHPSGRNSFEGEVYSEALVIIRTLEGALGEPVLEVPRKERDSKAHPSRQGLDKYILEHKAFACCENKGTGVGRFRNALRRNLAAKLTGADLAARKKDYERALNPYIKTMCDKLEAAGKISETQCDSLKDLLIEMTVGKEGLTMAAALARYNEIFPIIQGNQE